MRIRPGDWLAFTIVLIAVFGIGGIHLVLSAGYLISCQMLGHPLGMWNVIPVVSAWGDASVVPGQVCVPSRGLIQVLAVIYIAVVIAAIVAIYAWVEKYKESDKKLIKDLSYRKGIAQYGEVKKNVGDKALAKKAGSIRPTLKNPQLTDVGRKLGTSQGSNVWLSAQDTCAVFGPPRSGKGVNFVINEILDAPGAVVTTSTRGDNAAATWKLRAAGGAPGYYF